SLHAPTRKHIALAAVFLALTFYAELSLGVMLLLVGALIWLLTLRRPFMRSFRRGFVMAVVIALTALIASPHLVPALRESLDPKYIPQYWGGAPVLSSDVVGMFTPSSLSTLFGSHDWPCEWLQVLQSKSRFVDLNTFVIGFGVSALAAVGAWRCGRAARVWLWLALSLIVLAWGPILHVNGKSVFDLDGIPVTVGLPYIALHYIPVLNGLRAPHRFGVVAMLPLAMLVGFAAAWLLSRVASKRLLAAVLSVGALIAVTAEHLSIPIPLHAATVPRVYERIAQEPGAFTILEVPLGWRSGFGPIGTENTQLQFFQTAHHKFLLSGFAARTPSFIFDYYARQPILNALAVLESEGRLPSGDAVHDRALAAELAYFFDLRYLLVHPPASAPTPYDATSARVRDYVREVFALDEMETSDGIALYRVQQPDARATLLIDFGSSASNLNRAEGWARDEQVGGASANLRWNGTLIASRLPLSDGWHEYGFDVPASAVQSGLNELIVRSSSSAAPADVLPPSDDKRPLSIAVDWVRIDLQ
ncbi:MAG: hypothetical protein LC737_02095, partial [Chloroflexi bacterium]|nr:hypothetical protein [Chloroflexota bacterium]